MGSKALAVPQDRDEGQAGTEIPALSFPRLLHPSPSKPPPPSLCVSPPAKLSCPPPQGITEGCDWCRELSPSGNTGLKRAFFQAGASWGERDKRSRRRSAPFGRDFPERGVINHHKLYSAKPESCSPTAACKPGGGPGLISRIGLKLQAGRICWGLHPARHGMWKWI